MLVAAATVSLGIALLLFDSELNEYESWCGMWIVSVYNKGTHAQTINTNFLKVNKPEGTVHRDLLNSGHQISNMVKCT